MSHFARIENGTVVQVIVCDDNAQKAQAWLDKTFPGATFVQTSYNTQGGVHKEGGTPLRKNFAGIGYKYDATRDAFTAPKPPDIEGHGAYTLDEQRGQWKVPDSYAEVIAREPKREVKP